MSSLGAIQPARELELVGSAGRLALEVAVMAGRLARLLDSSSPDNLVLEGQSFLWSTFQAASGDAPLESWHPAALGRGSSEEEPLDRLRARFDNPDLETDLLILAAMPEQHEGLAAVLRNLHPSREPRVTVGLAAQVLGLSAAGRVDLRRTLELGTIVRHGVMRLGGEGPFFERSLVPAERLWSAMHGLDVWPDGIRKLHSATALDGLEEWFDTPEASRAADALRRDELCVTVVAAEDPTVAYDRALALAAYSGRRPAGFEFDAETPPEKLRFLSAHCLSRGSVPVLLPAGPTGPGTISIPDLAGFPGPILACTAPGVAAAPQSRPMLVVPVDRLSPSAARRVWLAAFPKLGARAADMAWRFPLEPAQAAAVARDLGVGFGPESELPDVVSAARARSGFALRGGVKLIRPHAGWDDLVLSRDRLGQLREALDRLGHQEQVLDEWRFLHKRPGARGVRMLFSGPPGVGKTLAAEVMARELSMDLLVVDIARVVSKWIGETEKNLAAVFDTAERTHAALFFDEADALFGKRTEVSDAHDRYANLETAYLLSRLERFEGLAILATNLRQNIDPAFVRRLEFVVDFVEPDRQARQALWRHHLPADAPLDDDVDLEELAGLYPVVGALIRNAAVAAAFLASADGKTIRRRHLVHALKREYRKARRSFPGSPASADDD